jgi:hypothetical protein
MKIDRKLVVVVTVIASSVMLWISREMTEFHGIGKLSRVFGLHRSLFEQQVSIRRQQANDHDSTKSIPALLNQSGINRIEINDETVFFHFESMPTDAIEAIVHTQSADVFPVKVGVNSQCVVYEFKRINKYWSLIVFDTE